MYDPDTKTETIIETTTIIERDKSAKGGKNNEESYIKTVIEKTTIISDKHINNDIDLKASNSTIKKNSTGK